MLAIRAGTVTPTDENGEVEGRGVTFTFGAVPLAAGKRSLPDDA